MSKIGLRKQLSVIIDEALKLGSLEHRLFKCEPWERKLYLEWKVEYDAWCKRVTDKYGADYFYRVLLEEIAVEERDLAGCPRLRPDHLRDRLFPVSRAPQLPADATLDEMAEAYTRYVQGDG